MLDNKELEKDELDQVTGGTGDTCDCSWNGIIKYEIKIGYKYVRNNCFNYVYKPLKLVSSPHSGVSWVGGGNSFYVFSCEYYEFGKYVDTHNVSFGENDIITEAN